MKVIYLTLRNTALGLTIAGLMSVGAAAQSSSQDNPSRADQASSNSPSQKSASSGQLSLGDKTFMKKAAEGGLAEVELGQLAAQKGQSEQVKQFGQKMVDDHSKANDQLKQLASGKGVTLPQDLNARDKAMKERLSQLSGDEFDRAYARDMVNDHSKDVAEFRHESKAGKDPEVKSFAQQTLPTLEQHLQLAKSIAPKQSIKEKKAEGNSLRGQNSPQQ